jgi:transposase
MSNNREQVDGLLQVSVSASPEARQIIEEVMRFLQLLMCVTLVKRVVSMLLIAFGLPNKNVTELTGLCDKSVRTLRKSLENGEIDSLFSIGKGGRKRKLKDVESEIVEAVNSGSYHSQQEIADMVHERYGIRVTPNTISRLLKKTASSG